MENRISEQTEKTIAPHCLLDASKTKSHRIAETKENENIRKPQINKIQKEVMELQNNGKTRNQNKIGLGIIFLS